MALDLCGDVRVAYLRSQDVLRMQALDARITTAAVKDFHDLMVERFNHHAMLIPSATMNAEDLHSFFQEPIVCAKCDNYTVTRQKSKQIFLDMKHKLNKICK
jgi:hypothetical protein